MRIRLAEKLGNKAEYTVTQQKHRRHLPWSDEARAYGTLGRRYQGGQVPRDYQREAVEACARETRGIITVEEHNIIGGLGSAVVETLAEEPGCPVVRIGIPDIFPVIGPTFELRRHLGLTAAAVMEKARQLLARAKNR